MGEVTTIGWTDKAHNEWIGCQKVMEAECGDRYALRWAKRHGMDVLWGRLRSASRICWRCLRRSCFCPVSRLVEPVTLLPWLSQEAIDWVMCGGYSGSQHRPMELAWARQLRDECQAHHVVFFVKQFGSVYAREHGLRHPKGEDIAEFSKIYRSRSFRASESRRIRAISYCFYGIV